MRGFQQMQRLSKGIISDRLGVPGALLEADDVVPLDRGEGFRTRGGKTSAAFTNPSGYTWPIVLTAAYRAWDMLGVVGSEGGAVAGLVYGNTAGGLRFAAINDNGEAYALPSQALDHAGTALTFTGRTNLFKSHDAHAALFHGEILVPYWPSTGIALRYAGARSYYSSLPWSTGTCSGAAGSTLLTGAGGTLWLAHATPGSYIYINDADTSERAYRVIRANSDVQIVLDRPLAGDVAASTAYRIDTVAPWVCKPGTFGVLGAATAVTTRSTVAAGGATSHQGRVFVWDTVDADNTQYKDRLRWSAPVNETSGHWGGAEWFDPNAYVDVFPGEGAAASGSGSGIKQCVSYRGALYIFKGREVFALRGYLATDGRDEGAGIDRVEVLPGDLVSRVVPMDDGLVFATREGIMLLTASGTVNLSDRAGFGELYRTVFSGGGFLSVVNDRLIMQSMVSLSSAAASGVPNTLVFNMRLQSVTTQTTLYTTNIITPWSGKEVAFAIVGEGFVRWDKDNDFSSLVAEGGRYPTMRLTSHPIGLAQRGTPNARVRAMQVRAKVIDSDATDPVLGVTLLLGEQGTNTAVEAAIVATSDVEEQVTTEQWHRLKTAGTPPVDSVRVRLVQEKGSTDVRVTELGVEAVGVARFR